MLHHSNGVSYTTLETARSPFSKKSRGGEERCAARTFTFRTPRPRPVSLRFTVRFLCQPLLPRNDTLPHMAFPKADSELAVFLSTANQTPFKQCLKTNNKQKTNALALTYLKWNRSSLEVQTFLKNHFNLKYSSLLVPMFILFSFQNEPATPITAPFAPSIHSNLEHRL